MNESQFIRSEMVLGSASTEILASKKVIIFGLGGVGSYAAEALARAGVGSLYLVDKDTVSISNLNRQLCALHSTIGRNKTDVTAERIKDINPGCNVTLFTEMYLPGNSGEFFETGYDYIADAVDNVTAKIDLAVKSAEKNIPIISAMGTGNKSDPSLFRISDIYETENCPLCRVMRNELRKRNIEKLNVVWSPEVPAKVINTSGEGTASTPGSLPFVPGAAGLIMAGKIITDLCKGS